MQQLTIIPGQCCLYPDFLAPAEGRRLLEHLQSAVRWEQHTVKLFGRVQRCPRLSAWHGDPEAGYQYSGVLHRPRPWLAELRPLRRQIEAALRQTFNSVLLNYYRDGNDGMGLHSDDEKELGRRPVIASLSVGQPRWFVLRPRNGNRRPGLGLELPHGSLLVMRGACQRDWRHGLPKTRKPVGPRINLTWRQVGAGAA